MITARVIGQVVCTLKHDHLQGRRLLVVQPETHQGLKAGKARIAVDLIGADPSEQVLIVDDGAAARSILGLAGPIRCVIVGSVDEVDVGVPTESK
jgi:ethanolamine utilization protein EutN